MDFQIENVKTAELHLDWKNPRLAEFNMTQNTPPKEIFNVLWENMALEEIVISLVAHGFFNTEPLIVVIEAGNKVVIEGNRRLAAVKIVQDANLIGKKLDAKILEKIDSTIIQRLDELPVIIVKNREEAWRFVGFKHINGPAKWNSFAKAQYIAQIHKDYKISLDEIAFQVGDTHNTVQKLFQGMMVIEQAEKEHVFNREDVKRGRLYFSHLYTALQYEGFKNFIEIVDASHEAVNPVPSSKYTELEELLLWLYGSKKQDIEPIIKTQNPDLKRLEHIIKRKDALSALRNGATIDFAFEISRPQTIVFEENLFAAKRHLDKAWSYVNEGYSGDKDLLKSARSLAVQADELYNKMDEKCRKVNLQEPKKRLTEEI